MVAPLTTFTRVRRPFVWSPEANTAFQALKERFTSAPVFQMPDPALQFVITVDASYGAVLSQRATLDQKLHPCAFFSRRFYPGERNYDIRNRELLAVKLALEEWHHSLSPFSLFYHPGSRNGKLDALCRQFVVTGDQAGGPEPILPLPCMVASLTPDVEDRIRAAIRTIFMPSNLRSEVLEWAMRRDFPATPGFNGHVSFCGKGFGGLPWRKLSGAMSMSVSPVSSTNLSVRLRRDCSSLPCPQPSMVSPLPGLCHWPALL